jgi:hypothetical protein
MHPTRGFVWLVFVTGLVTASGCGGDRGGENASSAGTANGTETARLIQLDRAEQQREAQAAADQLLWLLLDQSGLVEALGKPGAEQLRTEFNSMFGQIRSEEVLERLRNPTGPASADGVSNGITSAVPTYQRTETTQRLIALLLPATAWAGDGDSGGGGLPPSSTAAVFGMAELSTFAMTSYMGHFDNLAAQSASTKLGDLSLKLERGRTQLEIEHAKTVDGAELKSRNVMDVQVCPAADGTFKGNARIDVSMAKGDIGGRAEIDVQVVGTVDDDARLVTVEHEYRIQMSDHGAGMAWFADASSKFTVEHGSTNPRLTSESGKINRVSSKIPPEMVSAYHEIGVKLGIMIAGRMTDLAKKAWESGKCVSLEPKTQPASTGGLVPSSKVSILAPPRSLLDGTPTRGSVTARLAGATSVAPADTKTPADATFTYVAPPELEQKATVALEARSRRGVGRAEVVFDTSRQRLEPISEWGDFKLRGVICDTGKPFKFDAVADGNEVTLAFTPVDANSGTIRFSGNVEGAVIVGTGTYKLDRDRNGGSLTMNTSGTGTIGPITVPSFVATEAIALGPSNQSCGN